MPTARTACGGFLVGAALWAAPFLALAYASPGSPQGYVNDFAGVLSEGATRQIESDLAAFAASTSNEITLVTVANMGGDYIENYAVKLFEEWKIGTSKNDNGVLLLLSIEDRKLRIEVGYGLEGALPDSIAAQIIEDMTPLLKQGDYDGAALTGVNSIMSATRGEYVASAGGESLSTLLFNNFEWIFVAVFFVLQWLAAILGRSKSWYAGGILGGVVGATLWAFFISSTLIAFFVTAVLVVVGSLFDYAVSHAYANATRVGTRPPWWAGGTGHHSGGGFGGFGGGRSGGGGASGGW